MLERESRPQEGASVRLLASEGTEGVPETGSVESVQEAEVLVPRELLERLWRPEQLERLGRAYWRFLTRVSLGLLRIVYEPQARVVVLLTPRLPLIRFRAPEYETSSQSGRVTWRIERGILVAGEGRGRGYLRIEVSRPSAAGRSAAASPSRELLHVRLEVRNFYPWLRGGGRFARFGTWLYAQTQLRFHVLIGNAFLRSLARFDLPPSRVGAIRGEIERRP